MIGILLWGFLISNDFHLPSLSFVFFFQIYYKRLVILMFVWFPKKIDFKRRLVHTFWKQQPCMQMMQSRTFFFSSFLSSLFLALPTMLAYHNNLYKQIRASTSFGQCKKMEHIYQFPTAPCPLHRSCNVAISCFFFELYRGILVPQKWSRLFTCCHASVLCYWQCRNVNSPVAGTRILMAWPYWTFYPQVNHR